MPLSLHVLPPAFSLPSINADCLAAIAYLNFTLPRGSWVLVADGAVEGAEIPSLHDGTTIIRGFNSIVSHLRKISNGQWDLDASLTAQQKADCIAFTSHTISTLPPLISLSLYANISNYHNITRPAYGSSLPFPESWIIPPSRHNFAISQSEVLNIPASSLDPPTRLSSEAVDVLGDGEGEELGENPTVTPGLNSTKQTEIRQHLATKKLLRTHLSHALDGLTLLLSTSTSPWIFSTPKPTSLDCLLLSHLSLLTLPNLPSPLIPGTIITSYPSITDYTRKSVAAAFGTEGSTINDAFGEKLEVHGEGEEDEEVLEQYENMRIGEGDTGKLPWRRPRGRNLGEVVGGVAGRALGALKGVVVA